MSTAANNPAQPRPEKNPFFLVRRLVTPANWEAYLIPLPSVPLALELRPLLLIAMTELLQAFAAQKNLAQSIWLLLDELHHENAVREISRNAALWNPSMGLGLRPEDPPPRSWTGDDLLERDFNTPIPPLKHTIVMLETDQKGMDLAARLLTGFGALIHTLQNGTATDVSATWYDIFQPTIEEEGYAAFPIYTPIFGVKSLAGVQAETLSKWMGEVDIYIRESAEDTGVFLLSRHPLGPAFEAAKHIFLFA